MSLGQVVLKIYRSGAENDSQDRMKLLAMLVVVSDHAVISPMRDLGQFCYL